MNFNRIARFTASTFGLTLVLSAGVAPGVATAGPSETRTVAKKVVSKRKVRKKRQRWPTRRPKEVLATPPKLGNVPFPEGERLAFKVRITSPLLNTEAGEVILAVGQRTKLNGRAVVPLAGFMRSNELLSTFYPIDDRLQVLVDEKTFQPLESTFHISENGTTMDYKTVYNQPARHILSERLKDGKKLDRDFTSADDVYEALTSIYAARRIDLKPGLEFQYYIWDGRKERLVTITVAGEEKVWTPAGWFEATRVDISSVITGGFIKPDVLDTPKKTGSAWFANDAARTPLKVVTPTKLGQAEALLTRRYIDNSSLTDAVEATP